MNNEAMTNRAKQLVVDYFNAHVDVTDGKKLTMEDVFIVNAAAAKIEKDKNFFIITMFWYL